VELNAIEVGVVVGEKMRTTAAGAWRRRCAVNCLVTSNDVMPRINDAPVENVRSREGGPPARRMRARNGLCLSKKERMQSTRVCPPQCVQAVQKTSAAAAVVGACRRARHVARTRGAGAAAGRCRAHITSAIRVPLEYALCARCAVSAGVESKKYLRLDVAKRAGGA